MVDLSAYAGEEVELIFNTNASEPGQGATTRATTSRCGARRRSSFDEERAP